MNQTLPSLKDCKKYSEELCKTLEKIIEKIIPSPEEEELIQQTINAEFSYIKNKLLKFKDEYKFKRIELHGSAAKGTWLKDEIDLDIFIIFTEPRPKKELEKMIRDIAKNLEIPHEFRHSEHPYIRLEPPNMYPADIVPAFDLGGKKFISATDRTLYHTRYIKSKIDQIKINEVRLLKKFLKTINAYGAEIKVQGFSGYVTELLILKLNSMIKTLEFIAKKDKFAMSIETEIKEKEKLHKKFNSKYIIIDPVDPKRNTLAALSEETYNKIRIAAKLFLHKPNIEFFLHKEKEQEANIKKRNIYLTEITFTENTPPDKKWGILKKLAKQLKKQLKKEYIEVLYLAPLEDKAEKTYIITETLTPHTPNYRKTIGPPVDASPEHLEKFIKKHRNAIAGPWIEENRLVVIEITPTRPIEKLIQQIIEQLTRKYQDTIEKTNTKKLKQTKNPEIIKHINRKYKWLLLNKQ